MAKYLCKACGQTFEADSKPDKCPICGAPASEIEEVKTKKKGLDTNSNTYIIVYSIVLVVVVAFLLAFVASALKPQQDANVKIDTMQHKLNALNIRGLEKSDVEAKYAELKHYSKETILIGEDSVEFFEVDGQRKILVPVKGRGLWGGIWGYVALNDDYNTIYGTDFQHESETAGLGALIAEQPFQESFIGKKVFDDNCNILLTVVKKGKQGDIAPENYVDGVTGATLTSNGVNDMLKQSMRDFVESVGAKSLTLHKESTNNGKEEIK